jgi:hypothetical protein
MTHPNLGTPNDSGAAKASSSSSSMLTAFPGSFEVDDEDAWSFRSWLEKSEESSSSRFEFSGPSERGVAEKRRMHDDDGRGTDRAARRLRWTFGANIIVGDGDPKLSRPSSKVRRRGCILCELAKVKSRATGNNHPTLVRPESIAVLLSSRRDRSFGHAFPAQGLPAASSGQRARLRLLSFAQAGSARCDTIRCNNTMMVPATGHGGLACMVHRHCLPRIGTGTYMENWASKCQVGCGVGGVSAQLPRPDLAVGRAGRNGTRDQYDRHLHDYGQTRE